jgi:hypothetical protein
MEWERQDEPFALPVDIHEGLFRTPFHDARYQAWTQTDRCWQLHISGGPESGKTTLAALIARQLWCDGTAPVALLHVHNDEPSSMQLQDGTPSYDRVSHSESFSATMGLEVE